MKWVGINWLIFFTLQENDAIVIGSEAGNKLTHNDLY